MSGRPVDADSPSRNYGGKTIKFCCEDCKRDWDAMPDSAKSIKLATKR